MADQEKKCEVISGTRIGGGKCAAAEEEEEGNKEKRLTRRRTTAAAPETKDTEERKLERNAARNRPANFDVQRRRRKPETNDEGAKYIRQRGIGVEEEEDGDGDEGGVEDGVDNDANGDERRNPRVVPLRPSGSPSVPISNVRE